MKQITIAICFILLSSCNTIPPEKPFVIVSKERHNNSLSLCKYGYRFNGSVFNEYFIDSTHKYNINDIIK